MLSREQRNPLSEWWWTVDRLQLGAIIALILGGIILSLAASPPVATRIERHWLRDGIPRSSELRRHGGE